MLTHERLLKLITYDPDTGLFKRNPVLNNPRPSFPAGRLMGTYWVVKVDGVEYKASRLAWFYMTKKWPVEKVDHKDRNRVNNRWENLREATNSQNMSNDRRLLPTCGVRGVERTKHGTYRVRIRDGHKKKHIGTYSNLEEAEKAFKRAFLEKYKGFTTDINLREGIPNRIRFL